MVRPRAIFPLGNLREKKKKNGLLVDLFVQMLCITLELRTANLKSFFLAGCFSTASHQPRGRRRSKAGGGRRIF